MQTILKNKWLSVLILLLLVANIATLSMYWYAKLVDRPKPEMAKRGAAATFLIKELAFSAEQEKQYRDLIQQHQKQSRLINEQLKESKSNYFDLLQEPQIDSLLADAQLRKITAFQQQLEELTFHHFLQVKKLCTPKQQIKFQTVINKAMRMMGPKQQGPPPPKQDGHQPPHGVDGPPPPPEHEPPSH